MTCIQLLLLLCAGSSTALVLPTAARRPLSRPRSHHVVCRKAQVSKAKPKNSVAVDGYLAKSAAELFTPENRVPFAFGAFAVFGQLTQPLAVGLDRLGLIKLPPLNALTAIANAAMEAEIKAGGIPKIMGTAWVQGFYSDLIGQYNAAPEGFLQAYCGDTVHAAWCTADTVVSALQVGSQ